MPWRRKNRKQNHNCELFHILVLLSKLKMALNLNDIASKLSARTRAGSIDIGLSYRKELIGSGIRHEGDTHVLVNLRGNVSLHGANIHKFEKVQNQEH